MRVGFVHTVPSLAPRFDALLAARRAEATAIHLVDPRLLATAVRSGVDERVHDAVAAHAAHLAAQGADAVLVTCSSIGEAAEAAAPSAVVPVVRVDAAMASSARRIAAAGGGRIAVLATLAATLGPTSRLLARDDGAEVHVRSAIVDGALAAREAGDERRHDELIAQAVRSAAADADVVVLAQASMAAAAALSAVAVPVLSSPDSAIDATIVRIEGAA